MALLIDETAKGIAFNRWGLPECLHVPIAAVDEDAIRNYIGNIDRVVSGRKYRKAFLVTVPAFAPIDPLLPISDHPNAGIFHARQQVWVHVAYKPYRPAYKRALPHDTIDGLILSHAMNRDTAAYKGFDFVRLDSGVRYRERKQCIFGTMGKGTAQTERARRHPSHRSTLHPICRLVRSHADARHDARWRSHGRRQ